MARAESKTASEPVLTIKNVTTITPRIETVRFESKVLRTTKTFCAILLDAGFMIILPDGDSEWYVDSPVRPKSKYATYFEKLLRLAETYYRLSRDPKAWKKHNPIRFAEKLRGKSILLTTGDEAFDRTMNENFCKELDRLKIPCRFEKLEGTHHFGMVRKSLPLVIQHVQAAWGLEKTK